MNLSSTRMLIAGALVVLALGVLLIIRPGSSDESSPKSVSPAESALTGPTGLSPMDDPPQSKPKQKAEPQIPEVTVQNGEPLGGVEEIEVDEGEQVRFTVKSDTDDEVHVHGFDVSQPVGPGEPASFDFKAGFTGVFEVELELTAVPIIELQVNP